MRVVDRKTFMAMDDHVLFVDLECGDMHLQVKAPCCDNVCDNYTSRQLVEFDDNDEYLDVRGADVSEISPTREYRMSTDSYARDGYAGGPKFLIFSKAEAVDICMALLDEVAPNVAVALCDSLKAVENTRA